MKIFRIILVLVIIVGGVVFVDCEAPGSKEIVAEGDSLFAQGQFNKAYGAYQKVLAKDAENYQAIIRLSHIALLSNKLEDAEKWLTKAIELAPVDQKPVMFLAEAYYRADDFSRAAPLMRAVDREAMAAKLESFKDVTPYLIESETDVTAIDFVTTDPLPVVKLRINGSEEVYFIIDTGGAELIVDSEFAKEVGAVQFGAETGTFAGGKQAPFEHGRVDSVALGDFVVKNVPVHTMDVRHVSAPIFGGTRIDGIIGTVFLYHFIPTLDYAKGQLILRLRTAENLKKVEQDVYKEGFFSTVVPFWMAGDHYMVAWGTVNRSKPFLFFVDTGLAGGGFTCPKSTLELVGIELSEEHAVEGIGGGGTVKIIPFTAKELTLGTAKQENIRAFYNEGPFGLENLFGFHIGGLISHQFFRDYALTMDFDNMMYYIK